MLHTLVDKVFLITTLNSVRFEYIKSHLKDNNIEYEIIIAPDCKIITDKIKVLHCGEDNRPALSLLSAYQSIIECSKLNNYKKICVLEDDCYFVTKWNDLLNDFLTNIPIDWDLINVGYHPLHETDTIKIQYNTYAYIPKNWHHTTHCMIINNTIFDQFLTLVQRWNYTIPTDYIFNEIYKNDFFKSFCPRKPIVYQLSVRDKIYSIDNTNIRFKSLIA